MQKVTDGSEFGSPLSKAIEERLSKHDEALQLHRQRLDSHREWLRKQREMPNVQAIGQMLSSETQAAQRIAEVQQAVKEMDTNSNTVTAPVTPKTDKMAQPIEDYLLESGKKLMERKEQLRLDHLEKLKDDGENFQPEISQASKEMASHRQTADLKIEERLSVLEKNRQDHIETLRERQQHLDNMYPHKPVISKMSQELPSRDTIVINEAWAQEKEQRLSKMREQQQKEEEKHVYSIPQLSARTLKIVNKMKERRPSNVPIEEYLEQQEIKRQDDLLQRTEVHMKQLHTGTPKITPHAAQLIREGSITDRLYEQSFQNAAKRQELERQKMHEEEKDLLFSPNILTRDYNRGLPVYDDLLQRGEMHKSKQYEKMQQIYEIERDMHHPRINPVSKVIASSLPSTAKERLYGTAKLPKTPRNEEDLYSFKPEINQKSREIEENRGSLNSGMNARVDHMLMRDKKKQESIQKLKDFYNQKELEECTFTPRTRGGYYETLSKDFNERQQQWDRKRSAKVAREKAVVQKKEVENCTFRPNTDKRVLEMKAKNEIIIDDPLGFDEFVARQKQARENKENALKGVFSTGDKWKNQSTVPVEFNLGKHKPVKIRSLQKPTSPPNYRTQRSPSSNSNEDGDEQYAEEMDENEDAMQRTEIDPESIPPQGLFSSHSTLSILGGLHFSPSREQDDSQEEIKKQPSPSTMLQSSPSHAEWLKRKKEKEESITKAADSPRPWRMIASN